MGMSEREDHHHVGVRAAQLDQGLLGVGVGEGGQREQGSEM